MGTQVPDDSNIPLYVEIQRDIERKIISGQWGAGFRVPSEMALTRQYDCSRMTVNKALSSLASAGLIVRRRRSGSFVSAPRIEEPVLQIQDIKAEILESGRTYHYTILKRSLSAAPDEPAAGTQGMPARARLLGLDIVHYAGGDPFVWETREINLDAVPEAEHETFADNPPGTWLLAQVPWSDAEHSIGAVSADRLTAERLGIARGDACLLMERRTWKSGQMITHVRFVYAGGKHQFVARFSPPAS